ncbi:hypothetical protein DS901_13775 [Loktanella sp. D2R18]|uniref:YjbH domain-containing protein n=1 Tax=Rhodobacterales TaxID=204455 RepID=UPI000DEABA82|nr:MULTISPECIES: YjbH domain-containing protein [Rhodobacterales]MDO6588956.1 YjbH domain-containing protein [Yoonia sp. 1_MG-2023]RBW41827.1 hypothetical protein DS901_13775 [Loktanella sp. D2R18]
MRYFVLWVLMATWPIAGQAQHYNTYGMPGLIDMSVASSAPDAELAFSVATFASRTRGSATFQLSDRMSVSLRYAQLRNLHDADGRPYDQIFDRSFGLHYRLFDETTHRPAVAIGVNDFVGTGIYAGEYIVATKALSPQISGTLGLGWGRLASHGGFPHPLGGALGDRPDAPIGEGGAVTTAALFHGDTAVFGGLTYQPHDDVKVILEYSSDGYRAENGSAFDHQSPWNLGLIYWPRPDLQLSAQYLYGNEFGLSASYGYNLKSAPVTRPPSVQHTGPFDWQIKPYIAPSLFDPDAPLRADFGLALTGEWRIAPSVTAGGELRQHIAGNLHRITRESDSVLPHVRSDFAKYSREGDLDLNSLTLAWYEQPYPNVATRLTLGLLEEMYAGASAEALWQPPGSAVALGVELNALQQRGYESDFRLRDYQVLSGHGSFYWDAGGGYHVQVDAGRYLAKDWGGTLTLSRRFENGWSVGAFATLTDISFAEFGEGSFDKGIMFTIPLVEAGALSQTIRPVTRDGGARVHVDGRLYTFD